MKKMRHRKIINLPKVTQPVNAELGLEWDGGGVGGSVAPEYEFWTSSFHGLQNRNGRAIQAGGGSCRTNLGTGGIQQGFPFTHEAHIPFLCTQPFTRAHPEQTLMSISVAAGWKPSHWVFYGEGPTVDALGHKGGRLPSNRINESLLPWAEGFDQRCEGWATLRFGPYFSINVQNMRNISKSSSIAKLTSVLVMPHKELSLCHVFWDSWCFLPLDKV